MINLTYQIRYPLFTSLKEEKKQLQQLYRQIDLNLKHIVMGANLKYDLLLDCQNQYHPVEGEVSLYRLKGEQLFLFPTHNHSSLYIKLAEKIQSQNNPYLCRYFGNLFTKENITFKKSFLCQGDERQFTAFWIYHNYTLADRVKYHQQTKSRPSEDELWHLINVMFNSSNILMNHGLYQDFNFKNIMISVLRKMQVYWGNIKIGNSQRSLYQSINNKLAQYEALSPEQLIAFSERKIAVKLDLQKCVMHSIGRVLLLYANNFCDFSEIYDYQKLVIKKSRVHQLLKTISQSYSNYFFQIVKLMLVEQSNKRLSFSDLEQLIDNENYENREYRHTKYSKPIKQANSPTNTCSSSKVSVKVTQF